MRIIYFMISSSLMIGLVLLFRKLFRKKLSARVIYALWFLPFLRLLIPFGYWEVPVFGAAAEIINRPMAVVEELFETQDNKSLDDYKDTLANVETNHANVNTEKPSSESVKIYDAVVPKENMTAQIQENVDASLKADAANETINVQSNIKNIVLVIWFTGSIFLGGYVFIQNRKLRRKIDQLESVAKIDGIDICVSKEFKTPCLAGVRDPKIIITEEVYSSPVLYEYAIQHEMAHYRNEDHFYNADRVFICILHWWNPLVWYAAKCVSEDAELACDERVLKNKSLEERKNYGYALLQMIENAQNKPLCFATSFSGNKSSAKQRIDAITRKATTKKYVLFPVALLLMIFLVVGCVYPSEKSYIRTNDWKNGETEEIIFNEAEYEYSLQDEFQSMLIYFETYEYGELTERSIKSYGDLEKYSDDLLLRNESYKFEDKHNLILEMNGIGLSMPALKFAFAIEGAYAVNSLQSEKGYIEVNPGDDLILMAYYFNKDGMQEPLSSFDCKILSSYTEEELKDVLKENYMVSYIRFVLSDKPAEDLCREMEAREYSAAGTNSIGYQIADEWAKAFIDKNAETIMSLTTEDACQQLIENAMLDEEMTAFGWSSPWPMFNEEHYRIIDYSNKGAEILYYAIDSTPHVYVWKEKLEFKALQDELKISNWSLKRYDVISELEQYRNAYPRNQITDTPMDYYTNGLGEALNKNALLSSSEAYQPLFEAGSATLELLNISKDYSLVHYNTEENGEETNVHILFLNDDGSTDGTSVTMWQPYGKDGIWIPKEKESIPTLNSSSNESNAERLITQAEERLREGYTEAKLTYVDNAEVGWDYYTDHPWASDAERDALAQAALKELYTLTGFNVEECTYTTNGRSMFIFGKSAEYIKKSIAFYSRDYGFTLCGDDTPYMGFVNARRVHYSDVQQLDSPYHKEEYNGHAAIPTWFLEHSGIYQGERIKGYDTFNLDDTVFTHVKLFFDGGYYVVVMDEDIESVADIMGPYFE